MAAGRMPALLLLLLTACVTTQPDRYDLKITNGRIVDGSGAPWFEGDVGVRGDAIVAIGDLSNAAANRVINAEGRVVSPGFIDLLGFSYSSVLVDPRLEGKIRQGVTTEAVGEGHSPGPYSEAMIEQMNRTDPKANVTWRTLGEFMKVVERKRSALNFAFFVGAVNARSMLLGSINRDPTEEEMRQMEAIVDQAMRDGAIGISTSLIYVPATFAKTEEIVRLARVASRYGGVYFTHMRDEGDRIDAAMDEAFRIGREAEIPVNIWHLKITGAKNWGTMPAIVAKIEAARQEGLDVAANVYPYTASATSLASRAPDWALEGGYDRFLERMKDPEQRARIRETLQKSLDERGGPDAVLITRIPNPDLERYERKRVGEIAAMMQRAPVDAMLALLESGPYSPSAIFFSMREDDLRTALARPWVSVGSDASSVVGEGRKSGVHPRAYGTFPRVAGHYVRDVGLFTLEEAIRKMTSQAASRIKLWDRGLLRPGMKADIIVFDPATIRDVSTFEDPHRFSEGISDVIVNGVPVMQNGTLTGALPGRVLRKTKN